MPSVFDLSDRVALVTGASAGIGAAIAVALAEAGAHVMCHGNTRSPEATCDAVRVPAAAPAAVVADLTDRAAADRLIPETLARPGRLRHPDQQRRHSAAPAGGRTRRRRLGPRDRGEPDQRVPARACGRVARFSIARCQGKIVNVASLLSFQGGITVPGYAAAKGGVAQLTKALANEWAAHGINVNAIAPGYIATDNTAPLRADPVRSRQILERIPAGRWGEPRDVAGAAVFLASPAADYVHGHVLVVDGGWMGR